MTRQGEETPNLDVQPRRTCSLGGTIGACTMLSAGADHICALSASGGVFCWGNKVNGQLGDGSWVNADTPLSVASMSSGMRFVSAGEAHTCALNEAGGLSCWGQNVYGQLGDGTTEDRTEPVAVVGLESGVREVSAGSRHTCALLTTGCVMCWGDNVYGQIGDGTIEKRTAPVAVEGLEPGVANIAAGDQHTCALLGVGGVKCWGANDHGQQGDGTGQNRTRPGTVSDFP